MTKLQFQTIKRYVKDHFKRMSKAVRLKYNNKGFALIAAIIIMILLTALGLFGVSMLSTDIHISLDTLRSNQAFYIAEGGLQYYIKQLQLQTDSWETPPPRPGYDNGINPKPLSNGVFTIETANEYADEIDVICIGTVAGAESENIKRIVTVHVIREESVPQAFNYVLHAVGPSLRFNATTNSSITGDISCSDCNVTGVGEPGGPVHIGEVYNNSGVPFPDVDFSGYEDITAPDHIIDGDFTFRTIQSPYNGVYYITGNVIFEPGVTLNGSLIAPTAGTVIDMGGETDVTIIPNDSLCSDFGGSCPAIVSAGDILMGGFGQGVNGFTIQGLIYSQDKIWLSFSQSSEFPGILISNSSIYGDGIDSVNFTYDPNILSNPPPFFYDRTINTSDWQELYEWY